MSILNALISTDASKATIYEVMGSLSTEEFEKELSKFFKSLPNEENRETIYNIIANLLQNRI